jgi:hypothetical protein
MGVAGAMMGFGSIAIVLNLDGTDEFDPSSSDENLVRRHVPVPGGYGKDPDLSSSDAPWPLILTQDQLALVGRFADLILPPTDSAPAPSQIGIADFVNEWISAPYPDQLRDRAVATAGFNWLAKQPKTRSASAFAMLPPTAQQDVLKRMSSPQSSSPAAAAFIRLLRLLVVGGYYTTPEGFADIGYIGNIALPAFPEPGADVTGIIDARLAALGLRG